MADNIEGDLLWRTNRAKGWQKDLGYIVQDQLGRHDYLIGRKGEKPDDPGWNECRCGWEGYWHGFHPHVADHIRAALLSAQPFQVNSTETLAAMAQVDKTVILDADGKILVADDSQWLEPGAGSLAPALPVTVLHRPPAITSGGAK